MLQPLEGLLADHLVKTHDLCHFLCYLRTAGTVEELPAAGALREAKCNARAEVAGLYLLENAPVMEHMPAFKLHAWLRR